MINKYTERFLYNTKILEGEEGFTRYLTNKEEALRQLNGLIESIATGNDTYSINMFICDVQEAIKEIEE